VKTAVNIWLAAVILLGASIVLANDTNTSTMSPGPVDTITVERNFRHFCDFRNRKTYYPYRIGLALSGGGARGIAQIGVLKAFEEAGLDIDYIAGSSMGSIIGGLYASGYSAEEIEELVRQVDFPTLFSDSPQRRSLLMTQREEQDRYLLAIRFDGYKPYIPRALTVGQRLTEFLTDLTIRADYSCGGDFDLLPIPFRATATDIGTGSEVTLKSGSLADAMRASTAFPLAFAPVEIDEHYLMDGGIVNPIPVDVCRAMGADYVVAVNTVSKLLPMEKVDNPVDIANQVTTIMTQNALADQLKGADYILTPLMNGLESFSFKMHDSLVAYGYRAGQRAAAAIKRDFAAKHKHGDIHVQTVETASDSPSLAELKALFPIRGGQICGREEIAEALRFADRDMRFHQLNAILEPGENGTIIRLDGESNRKGDKIKYEFIGNTVLSDAELIEFFPPSDSPISLRTVKAAADSVVSILRGSGYDLAHVRTIDYDHAAGRISITFDEGFLDYVDIRGNERTRSWIIKANYPLHPGEPFDIRKSEQGLANIYASGYFEHVDLDIKPTGSGVHLTINVREKKFTQLRVGAHWDDEYQAEMFTELLDDNILGAGIQALGHIRLSSRRYNYYLSFKTNRLSSTLIAAQTRFYYSRLQRRLFHPDGAPDGYRQENRLGWSFLVGQQIARLGTIDIKYRIEDINTYHTITEVEEDHVLSAFMLKSTVETLNKFPYPDYGHYQDIAVEFTGKWLGGTFDEYTKISGMIEAFAPIGNYLNFHPRIAAGISTADLPDIEKFFIGGMYNFSGYRTDQLSGDKFVVTNLQLRIKLPYRFYFLGNFDYGNIVDDYEDLKIEEFRRGWGAALSMDTPLGPVDFGAGTADDMPWRLYFNAGLRF
jgi:NTE family protein